MTFKDYFSQTAADYALYRPHYPKSLFAYLSQLTPDRKMAWDCATGNGQVACELADYFDRVYASDASEQQIRYARQRDRVQYLVARAESTPFTDQSLDLIAVAQAFHWFDADAFYREVRRVLKPNGIIALWCYGFCQIPDGLDALHNALQTFYDTIDPFWPPERLIVTNQYQTIEFPFAEITPPAFAMLHEWTADRLIGYLTTWSAVQAYRRQNGDEPLSILLDAIAANYPAHSLTVSFPLSLRMGRLS